MSAKHQWNGERVFREMRRRAQDAAASGGVIIQRNVKLELSRPGRGTHWPGLPRRSSAPGDPPAVQFGQLRRSQQVDLSGLHNANPLVRVGTNVHYARKLECGTKHIAPRPHMRPGLARSKKPVFQEFRKRGLVK